MSAQAMNAVKSPVFMAVASSDCLLSPGIARAIKNWLNNICGITNSMTHPNTSWFICHKMSADTMIFAMEQTAWGKCMGREKGISTSMFNRVSHSPWGMDSIRLYEKEDIFIKSLQRNLPSMRVTKGAYMLHIVPLYKKRQRVAMPKAMHARVKPDALPFSIESKAFCKNVAVIIVLAVLNGTRSISKNRNFRPLPVNPKTFLTSQNMEFPFCKT
jgi:hypothetical protein